MPDLTVIRFIEHYGVYNAGETAGFPQRRAQELVDAGAAVFLEAPVTKAAPAAEEPAEPSLEAMTRGQLDARAAVLGIDTSGAKNKGAAIEAILQKVKDDAEAEISGEVGDGAEDDGESGDGDSDGDDSGDGDDGESGSPEGVVGASTLAGGGAVVPSA